MNPYAIARARSEANPATNLHFEQAEAVSWLEAHPARGTVLVSYDGVLEYLSRDAVSEFWMDLPSFRRQPCFYANRSLTTTIWKQMSIPIVRSEQSFSHNHEALLREAGFRIVTAREDYHEGSRTRLELVVAIATDGIGGPRYDGDRFEDDLSVA